MQLIRLLRQPPLRVGAVPVEEKFRPDQTGQRLARSDEQNLKDYKIWTEHDALLRDVAHGVAVMGERGDRW